jgi:hypothetical protein
MRPHHAGLSPVRCLAASEEWKDFSLQLPFWSPWEVSSLRYPVYVSCPKPRLWCGGVVLGYLAGLRLATSAEPRDSISRSASLSKQ